MKKITFLITALIAGIITLNAQGVYEVGEGKAYATITEAWDAAKADASTDIKINVAEGVYMEGMMSGIGGKKITITGSGADKTIIKKSDIENFDFSSGVNPGRVFQVNNAAAKNLELILENMSFQTVGFTNTNGGGVVNATAGGQKITIRNCNFKNVYARVGAIVQLGGSESGESLVFENCFVEESGAFDNNSLEGLLTLKAGEATIKNCTFINNKFNPVNIGNNEKDTDRNLRNGGIVSASTTLTSLVIENCIILDNNYTSNTDEKTQVMISMKPAVETSMTANLKDVIVIRNNVESTNDCDLLYNVRATLLIEDSYFNYVKNVQDKINPEDPAEELVVTDVTNLDGAVIDPALSYKSSGIDLEMDGDSPKIVVDEYGVKHLKKSGPDLVDNTEVNNIQITSANGTICIQSPSATDISIYNIVGSKVAEFKKTEKVDVALPCGIYIVKSSENYSQKVLVK